MTKAIIRPIDHKATGAHCPWPENIIGAEIKAELYDGPHKFFARVTDFVGCRGWDVMHGEAELVRIVTESETCDECGQELPE